MIDCGLQLLLVIDELYDFVARVLEILDDCVIALYRSTGYANHVEQVRLASTEIFDHETKAGVHLVVLLQSLVHLLCLELQIVYFGLLRGNITPQVLDLRIEHEFELFQLLGAFFKKKYVLLATVNNGVLMVNLILLLSQDLFKVLVDCLKFVLLNRLLINHAVELC